MAEELEHVRAAQTAVLGSALQLIEKVLESPTPGGRLRSPGWRPGEDDVAADQILQDLFSDLHDD
jgi:hypothetical protein